MEVAIRLEREAAMKLLIAVDESEGSTAAVERVAAMRWPVGSAALLFAVVRRDVTLVSDFFVSAVAEIEAILREEAARAEARLQTMAPALAAAGLAVTTRVVRGDARTEIIDAAREDAVDLVVVGSHGRTGLRKMMLGSVAAHVVAHAPCNVLVVKPAAEKPLAPPKEMP
jgi:nucleotide-binding universal stress UspA family protein